MNYKNTKFLAQSALLAAMYASLTLVLAPFSYGPIQFRLSEALVFLVLLDKRNITGLTLGAVIANYFSPLGIIDMLVGGTASFLSLYLMTKSKNLYLAAFWPCFVNGIIVGAALSWFYALPFWLIASQVFIGQAGVIYLLGLPLYKYYKRRGQL